MSDADSGEYDRRDYLKMLAIFLGIILFALAILVGVRVYETRTDEGRVQALAEALKKQQADDYLRAMADTYGGKTPQETLEMYIDAVQKGDYELASKYFIGDKQEKELIDLDRTSPENLQKIINLLKEDLKSPGSFSEKRDGFAIRKPLLVDFKLYPNGIWKIIEI